MKKVSSQVLFFLLYFIAVFILGHLDSFNFSLSFFLFILIQLAKLVFGMFIGWHFSKVDLIIFAYFTQPEMPFSLGLKQQVKEKNYKETWSLLDIEEKKEKKLAFRSFLFQLTLIFLAIFTLTSTVTYFGKILIMAIALRLLIEEWEDILKVRNISWLFWQIKREVSIKEQRIFLYLSTALFVFLTILMI